MEIKAEIEKIRRLAKGLTPRSGSGAAYLEQRIAVLEGLCLGNLTREEAAEWLEISVRGLKNLEYRHELIPLRIGRSPRFSLQQLLDYQLWRAAIANAGLQR